MKRSPEQYEIVLAHFERVVLLARHLNKTGADIHGHEYDYQSFGTWKMIAGSYRHRFQFLWDGRKRILTISDSFFTNLSNMGGDWKEFRKVEIDTDKGADPLKYLEDFFKLSH
jgi:hypothetical protein